MTTSVITVDGRKVLHSKEALKLSLTVGLMKPQQSLLISGSVVINDEMLLGSFWHIF